MALNNLVASLGRTLHQQQTRKIIDSINQHRIRPNSPQFSHPSIQTHQVNAHPSPLNQISAMAVNASAKAAMAKGRVEKAKSKKAKKEAARARAAVAREARFGKKGGATKATPKK